jgi:hypothetical protein
VEIITRAAAGLPPRPSGLTRHTGPWPGITWHHTGGADATWRDIYDWQVRNRPPEDRLIDIGYSFGIRRGRVTELRGWDYRPAGDHQNSRLQVVFMGTFHSRLPDPGDLAAALEFARYAEQRNGQPMPGKPHCDIWPAGHPYSTNCPGALAAWVRRNLATIGDHDMEQSEKLARTTSNPNRTVGDLLYDLSNLRDFLVDVPGGTEPVAPPAPGSRIDLLLQAARKVLDTTEQPAPIVTDEQLARVLRQVIGAVDGAVPPTS